MVIPAAVLSSILGSINGFVLAKWKFRGADVIFPLLLFGMFIPYQSILIPLVEFVKNINLYGGLPGLVLVHIIYGIPITTLTSMRCWKSISRMPRSTCSGTAWAATSPAITPASARRASRN